MPENQFLRGQASSVNPASLGSPFAQSTAASTVAARPPSRESIYGNARRLSAPANEQWLQRPAVQRPDFARISGDAAQLAEPNNERYTPRYGARIATPSGENQTSAAEIRTRASPITSTPVTAAQERARGNAIDYRAPINNRVDPGSNPAAASVAPARQSTPGYTGWTQNNPAQIILQEREQAREYARDAERQREQLERRTERPPSRRNESERENYGARYLSSGSNQVEQNQRRTDPARTAQESYNNTRSAIAPAISSPPAVRQEAARTSPPPEIRPAPQPRPERASIAEPKENPRNTHRPGQPREQER